MRVNTLNQPKTLTNGERPKGLALLEHAGTLLNLVDQDSIQLCIQRKLSTADMKL